MEAVGVWAGTTRGCSKPGKGGARSDAVGRGSDPGPIFGIVPVLGRAGPFVVWAMGCKSGGGSTRPLVTKTLAWGLATITRGGAATPGLGTNEVVVSAVLPGNVTSTGRLARRMGAVLEEGGAPVNGGAIVLLPGNCVVWTFAGEPVTGGALGMGGGMGLAGMEPEGGRVILGMGLVTAVDQAGGTDGAGAGVMPEASMGIVVAAEIFGRGVIEVEAGLSGRGGRLMRNVWRFGALGSFPAGGGTESAMMCLFIVISENVQWRNS